MRALIACAALAVAMVPAGAGAQSLSLTEAQALARLSPASPRVRAIRAAADIAGAQVQAAGRWPNPRLTVNREAAAGVNENIVTVTQALPITGRRSLDVAAASALAEATGSRADEELRRARAELRLAFAALLSAQAHEQALNAGVDRLRVLADALARREAAGDAAGFDRLRAEREVIDLETERVAASIARAHAQADVAAFFEASSDVLGLVAVAGERQPTTLPPLDALLARAEETRGELRALEQEMQSARLTEQAARRRRLPEPEIVAGTKSSSAGETGSVVAVHASVPLFDRFRPEQAAARARAAQASARAEVFRVALGAEIAALRAEVERRRTAADAYRTSEAASAELERIAQVAYDAGEQGILELLDAYRIGTAARVRQLELDEAVRRAEVELEFTSGWEMGS